MPAPIAATAPSHPAATVAWSELAPQRDYLVRYARRRLLDPALAEDLVHDVFEAVASGRALFGGRSALRSWLVAVLKHKIVDLVRERVGYDSLDAAGDDDGDGGTATPELACPQPRPDEVAEQRERLAQTLARIAALPEHLRRAVELRLLADADSDAVCRELSISESNLYVRLHRARCALAG
ncbi:MAG: sigma-70 family RNA polymerase sigma factor [Burkholderiales bacterium]|nr:sigma-70 family RNA polymerase sigma factor [Burkholderiales bacterium]